MGKALVNQVADQRGIRCAGQSEEVPAQQVRDQEVKRHLERGGAASGQQRRRDDVLEERAAGYSWGSWNRAAIRTSSVVSSSRQMVLIKATSTLFFLTARLRICQLIDFLFKRKKKKGDSENGQIENYDAKERVK